MTLEDQLGSLERGYRRIRTLTALGLGLLGLVLLSAQGRSSPGGEMVVKSLVLKDSEGNERARLETASNGAPRLTLFDQGGKVQVVLGCDGPKTAYMDIHGGKGRKLSLGTFAGTPALKLFGEKGLRILLSVPTDTEAGLTLLDSRGRVRAALTADDEKGGALELSDEKGSVVWRAPPKR